MQLYGVDKVDDKNDTPYILQKHIILIKRNLRYIHKMKVVYYTRPCFLVPALSLARELGKKVKLHLLLELSPEGWNNSLIDGLPKTLPTGILQANRCLRSFYSSGLSNYWKNLVTFNFIVHNCRRSIHPATWRVANRAAQFIRTINPDVIHFDDVSLRFVWGLKGLRKYPKVLSIHDIIPHIGEENWRIDLARTLFFSKIKQFILHNRRQRELFCSNYFISENRVNVISLGIYNIYRKWIFKPMEKDQKTVLFFGRLSKYKGLEILYKAAPLVSEKVENVRFVISGKPVRGYELPEPPQLPNGGIIKIINKYIPNNELAELFQMASVVVCPYIEATQSGVILTAYAFNTPVIASNTGGLSEYVWEDKSGVLVEPENHVQLAEAIVNMLADRKYLEQLQANVRTITTTELNWERIAQQTYCVYSKIIEDSHPSSSLSMSI